MRISGGQGFEKPEDVPLSILVPSFVKSKPAPGPVEGIDRERLERVLQDLLACRQLLDNALKDG